MCVDAYSYKIAIKAYAERCLSPNKSGNPRLQTKRFTKALLLQRTREPTVISGKGWQVIHWPSLPLLQERN
jgi:hypothetical protein